MHCAVAAAVAIATAILTGALLVGDSVRGSLRDLTLQRLGRVDQALTAPRPFRAPLAEELQSLPRFNDYFDSVTPAWNLRGSATLRRNDQTRRANQLDILGVPAEFWSLGQGDPRGENRRAKGVWISPEVARDLGARAGDELLLRLPLASALPADSLLGEKSDTTLGRRFRVAGVLPTQGLARFGLRPTGRPSRSVFLPLEELAQAIKQPGKANTLLVASRQIDSATGPEAQAWLTDNFRPALADYGLQFEELESGPLQISAEGLVLPPAVVAAAERAFGKENLQPITTYLANTLRVGDRSLSYSTVAGVDSTLALGLLRDADGEPIALADDQVILNRWAADRLEAQVGDTVELRFYEPESTHGQLREREPPLELQLKAIVPLEGAVADPLLTPQLAGVTDQDSIADWDLPFDLTEPITPDDEDYWDDHQATPKAFVSHRLARQVWATRWGSVSLLRLPAGKGHSAQQVAAALRQELSPAELGFVFQPVKQQGLDAASGTTPFDGLFLGFSLFLIAAALVLLVLLFRLSVEERAGELGLLAAIGFTPQRAGQLLGREALGVAGVGALLGLLLGIVYAALMITGLRTIWVAAIASPFLELHLGRWSLPIGLALGLGVAWLTTWQTLRQVLALSPQALLAGSINDSLPLSASSLRRTGAIWLGCLAAAVALGAWGTTLRGEAQAGAFLGVGALVLTGLLGFTNRHWKRHSAHRLDGSTLSLPGLAKANLARRPGRSTLTIALVASASFLLLAISAFRLAPTTEGTGGYDWFATSDLPLYYDLGTAEGRLEFGFSDEGEARLARCTIDSLRVHPGEDASCLNLYQTVQPRILGTRDAERVLGGFAWGAGGPELNRDLGTNSAGQPVVPVVLDVATAVYSLHLSGSVGDRLTVRDGAGRDATLEVVGLMKNSVLQGDLVVSDAHFRRLFPGDSGSGCFLIAAGKTAGLGPILEDRLDDYGFAATSTVVRLEGFLAVQNTYLSTFQLLGGLGLLLGTIGVAVVQLRSVIERRGELALLQAVGFRPRRVVLLVLLESLALLAWGLLLGAVAAALTWLPQWGKQSASLPWQTSAWLLATLLATGLVATWLATRGALRQPILPALRGE